MRIAFFHGLESPSKSDKSEYLEANYEAYCPALNYTQPGLFAEVLDEVKRRDIQLLTGSSMGGWFAYCISTMTGIPTVLFNPALHSRTEMYDPVVQIGRKKAKHVIILGKNDDVINPNMTIEFLKTNNVNFEYHFESNDHRTPVNIFTKWIEKNKINESSQFITFDEFKKINV